MPSLTNRQFGILGLTLITAVIHIVLAAGFNDTIFYLNGFGYIALAAALYFVPQLKPQRPLIRWVFIGYTALTIVLFFVFNPSPSSWGTLGIIDKLVEIVLVVLLWQEKG